MKTLPLLRRSLIEPLEPRIAPAANLILQNVVSTLPAVSVPGDSGKVTFQLTNTGDDDATGTSGIHIFLSSDATLGGDLLIGRFPDRNVAVPAGKTFKFTAPVELPDLQLPSPQFPEGNIFVIVQFVGLGKVAASNPVQQVFQFGKVGDRTVSLPFSDADGTTGKFVLGGGEGFGDLTVGGGTVDLLFTGTDAKTKTGVSGAKGGDGRVNLRDVTSPTPLGLLNLVAANLSGNVSLPGGVDTLGLGDVGGAGKSITIGPEVSGKGVGIQLGRVNDLDLTSQAGIRVLKIVDWQNPNVDPDTITAPFLTKLDVTGNKKAAVTGNFAASLFLDGVNAKGQSIDNATLPGTLSGAWTIAAGGGLVRKIVAGGTNQWTFTSPAGVDTLEVKGDLIGNRASAAITALFFDDIKVTGTLGIFVKATGAAPDGFAIENVTAGRGDGSVIEANSGGIKKVSVGEWLNGGRIDSDFLNTLQSTGKSGAGDFTANLTLAAPAPVKGGTLGKATIEGALRPDPAATSWTIDGDIGSITAGSIAANWSLLGTTGTGPNATLLGKLKVSGEVAGSIRAARMLAVDIDGEFKGALRAVGGSISDATLGKVTGGVVEATVSILDLVAAQWVGGSVTAGTISVMKILGGTKDKLPGNLANVNLTANDPAQGFITVLTVAGGIANVNINAIGNVGRIQASEWIGGSSTSNGLSTLKLIGGGKGGVPGDLQAVNIQAGAGGISGIEIAGRMDAGSAITTTGEILRFSAGGLSNSTVNAGTIGFFEIPGNTTVTPPLFSASTVTAGSIDNVAIREVGSGAAPFGFNVGSITRYSRSQGGVVTVLENLDAPGDFDVIDGTNYRVHIT